MPAVRRASTETPVLDTAALIQLLPFVAIFVLMYFLIIRPQQKRAKEHQNQLNAMKRNDTVVLSNGMIGKITRVEETQVMVEIASGVNVPVVKSMVAEVRAKGEPAPANDKAA
ncbi:preprotein translocase subunit YajC [Asticcacaulis sp. AND118]|uniref:preprotein translocase subunit YajC n=1 Tax=Asticcacaulis sp. AND118 TaxID=2840468 RepID=UPI00351DA6B0